jgi:hypothetical protein
MRRPRLSIARLMAVVLIIALDCAALRAAFPVLDVAFLVVVPVLEVGLFRMISRRGRVHPFWVGFEASGWAAVLAYATILRWPITRAFDVLLVAAIRFCTPRVPGVAHGLDYLFRGDGILLGLLPLATLLGLPMLLPALIGGRLADRMTRRRSGIERIVASDPLPEAPACAS